ncbi:MAG: gfo/Idh/MocA family oxidoreductase [Phycisphaera sp.]|nr:gfo/Idh/MocA family oxidoreductase [Phycisphaera sp.]
MRLNQRISRRRALKALSAAAAAPMFIPSHVLGANGATPPSEKVVMACIGVGWQGGSNMGKFLNEDLAQVVAVCDVDAEHLEGAANTVNKKYGNKDCKTYHDFREVLGRKDIDAVSIALPDHWHSIPAIMAANAGKDIYGEKPISHTLTEGRAMADAVARNKRIWQTGSWQRSTFNFRQGVELVRNGLIGKVTRVEVGLPSGHKDFAGTGQFTDVSDPPKELDYEFWVGPSDMIPYIKARLHKNWRWHYNFGGGQLMDWIGHHCDIAHWGLGNDDKIGPLTVEATGEIPPADAVWNTATSFRSVCQYPDDIELIIADAPSKDPKKDRDAPADKMFRGTKWIGDKGWVFVDRGKFEASNMDWTKNKFDPGPIRMEAPKNHWNNFLECCKSRKPAIAPAENAHRSASPGHLTHISMTVGRKLTWDAATETIKGDAEASAMLGRSMRSPWSLPG